MVGRTVSGGKRRSEERVEDGRVRKVSGLKLQCTAVKKRKDERERSRSLTKKRGGGTK